MIFRKYIYVLIAILITSCSSDLDFEQAESITLEPVYEADFFYTTIPVERFFNDENQQIAIQDEVITDFFDQDYFVENVKQVDFYFQITNTTSESFYLELIYYNAENEVTNVIETTIPPVSETPENNISEHIFSINNEELQALKTSVKVKYHIEAQSNDMSPDMEGFIDIQSKAKVYVSLTL